LAKDSALIGNNYSKINNACLLILTAIGITGALIYTKVALVPFVFSLFAYSIASPIVKWFQTKAHFPRSLSVIVTIFGFLLASGLLLFLVISSIKGG